jgi:hypothetical protein
MPSSVGSDQEKVAGTAHIENSPAVHEDALPEPGSPQRIQAEKRLLRKLDMRVLPTIIVIYIMNYIDVSSISFPGRSLS